MQFSKWALIIIMLGAGIFTPARNVTDQLSYVVGEIVSESAGAPAEDAAADIAADTAEEAVQEAAEVVIEEDTVASAEENTDEAVDDTVTAAPEEDTPDIEEESAPAFSYSDGIDETGFWTGLTALDYVELPEYMGIVVPNDTHAISEDAVQAEIDNILAHYAAHDHITDRAVEDGDTVNIDYVGSVDGVEFDGGSTGGSGIEVTIGETAYIDDFLEQLIGHMPGDTFDVNVTFPENYGVEELDGKDAVFVTTINNICVNTARELTDEFVAESLSPMYGWTTVQEMKDGIRADMQKNAVQSYVGDFIARGAAVSSLPEQLIAYQENAMVNYYAEYAASYGMDLETFLIEYAGYASLAELTEAARPSNEEAAKLALIYQAIAEASGLAVSDGDIAVFFKERFNADDYSMYIDIYGVPYLKQYILNTFTVELLAENAVLAE